MVTKVGLQSDFIAALKDLVELDYDAIEAYNAAIDRLENAAYRSKLNEFRSDHERHVREIKEVLMSHNEALPNGPSAKQWLTKGKVMVATLIGDNTILSAMCSNEVDTNTAYERLTQYEEVWPEARPILMRGLADEKKHKFWLESVIAN